MTCGIYMIQNKINNKMYIGQTVNIKERWKDHRAELRGGYHSNKHLQRSWDKYGEESFEFSILLECEESQLNTFEEYYIFELMTYDPWVGYNKTYGGDGCRCTEETRKKMSEANKGENHPFYGKHHTEETKIKLSEANKGKHHTEETKKKLSEANKGKTLSYETRKKMSKAHKSKISPDSSKRSKPVVQIDPDTNKVVKVWGSAREAEKQGGFNQSNISSCCKGKLKTHKGFRWIFLSDYEKLNGKIN